MHRLELALIVVIIAIGAFAIYLRKRRPVFVLGRERAQACRREQERLGAMPDCPSPLPGDYEFVPGEWNLLKPAPSILDEQLRKSCEQFRGLSAEQRARFTSEIPMDGLYTLMRFAQRAVVFALRNSDPGSIRDAATALVMVDLRRTDHRDLGYALAFVRHGAKRLGLGPAGELLAASELAGHYTKEFIGRLSSHKEGLRHWCGCTEVKTKFGIGVVRWDNKSFSPKRDLLAIAMNIGAAVDADVYQTEEITLAAELPDVWLRRADPEALKEALASVRAGASIKARLDPQYSADAQFFLAFILETDSTVTAEKLLEFSGLADDLPHFKVGVVEEEIFVLVIGSSWKADVAPFEREGSLNRLYEPILAALRLDPEPTTILES